MSPGAGLTSLFSGIGKFLKTPRYWSYALLPFGLLLLVYIGSAWLMWSLGSWICSWLPVYENAWGEFGMTLAQIFIAAMLGLTLLTLFLTLLIPLYELIGALFFDRLVCRAEKEIFNTAGMEGSAGLNFTQTAAALIFALNTVLIGIAGWIFSFFFPLIGSVLIILVLSYRLGFSYLLSSAFLRGLSIGELRQLLKGSRPALWVWGLAMTGLLLIPLAGLILLPAFALSGVYFFHKLELTKKDNA